MFLLYPFYAIGSLLATLLAYVVNPIIVLFVDKDGKLPRFLHYFETFDMPLKGEYWTDLKWLMRNPAYGFDLHMFGVNVDPTHWKVIRSNEKVFFAISKFGAFSYKHEGGGYVPAMKFGWKVFWFREADGTINSGKASWNDYSGRAPFCFSIVKP